MYAAGKYVILLHAREQRDKKTGKKVRSIRRLQGDPSKLHVQCVGSTVQRVTRPVRQESTAIATARTPT